MALHAQLVGNSGLYFCCYQLSLRGWNVMPTARNARGVDIVAYSPDAKHFKAIQVKTLSRRNPVPLGDSLDKIMGDYWVIVTRIGAQTPSLPTTYVLLPEEVIAMAHKAEKSGKVSYWLQPPSYDRDDFREKWDRISI